MPAVRSFYESLLVTGDGDGSDDNTPSMLMMTSTTTTQRPDAAFSFADILTMLISLLFWTILFIGCCFGCKRMFSFFLCELPEEYCSKFSNWFKRCACARGFYWLVLKLCHVDLQARVQRSRPNRRAETNAAESEEEENPWQDPPPYDTALSMPKPAARPAVVIINEDQVWYHNEVRSSTDEDNHAFRDDYVITTRAEINPDQPQGGNATTDVDRNLGSNTTTDDNNALNSVLALPAVSVTPPSSDEHALENSSVDDVTVPYVNINHISEVLQNASANPSTEDVMTCGEDGMIGGEDVVTGDAVAVSPAVVGDNTGRAYRTVNHVLRTSQTDDVTPELPSVHHTRHRHNSLTPVVATVPGMSSNTSPGSSSSQSGFLDMVQTAQGSVNPSFVSDDGLPSYEYALHLSRDIVG